MPDDITMTVKITNTYETGEEFEHTTTVAVTPPPTDPDDDLDDWAHDELFVLTGEGGDYCSLNAIYEVKVLTCPADPRMEGKSFEWGG